MLDRIGKADRISLAGAVLLFIALFLPWYGIESGLIGDGPGADLVRGLVENISANAFEAFSFVDILLLILSLGAIGLILAVALGKVDESYHRFVETIGGLAALLVLFRIVIQPDGAAVKWGIFVALIGGAAIFAGQFLDRTGKI